MAASGFAAAEPLRDTHDISGFSCGNPALDRWLRLRALRNQDSGDSRTFVLHDNGRVIAFYALSAASAARIGLPTALRRNAPDPVPLMLLGQLAVDLNYRGQGLGRRLLRDALARIARVSSQIGFRAIATHPIDAAAEAFYARYGFVVVPDSSPRLMILARRHLLAAVRLARSRPDAP